MPNMSVADISKIHGKWIESGRFSSLVSQKLGVSEREAYRKIKKSVEKKEILKIPLYNGTVVYGLPEFSPLSLSEKKHSHSVSRWLDERAERKKRERLLTRKENLLAAAQYCELIAKHNPQASPMHELVKNYRERIKEIDKELMYKSDGEDDR